MCLETVKKQYDPPLKKERWVWKAFEIDNKGDLRFPIYWEHRVWCNKWMKAKGLEIHNYPHGFHCFLKKKDARAFAEMGYAYNPWTLVKVKIKAITTEGQQENMDCIVANEMWIPKPTQKGAKNGQNSSDIR